MTTSTTINSILEALKDGPKTQEELGIKHRSYQYQALRILIMRKEITKVNDRYYLGSEEQVIRKFDDKGRPYKLDGQPLMRHINIPANEPIISYMMTKRISENIDLGALYPVGLKGLCLWIAGVCATTESNIGWAPDTPFDEDECASQFQSLMAPYMVDNSNE